MQINKLILSENKNQSKNQTRTENTKNKTYAQCPDVFEKNKKQLLSFTGEHHGGRYYTDQEVSDAKKYVYRTDSSWVQDLRSETRARLTKVLAESQITDWAKVTKNAWGFRALTCIGTLGLSEIINGQVETAAINGRVDSHLAEVTRLVDELKNEELVKKKAAVELKNATALAKVDHEKEVNTIHTKLLESFSDRLDMEKKGNKTEIPNCVMLIDEYDDLSKELIQWTSKNSDCNFIKLADNNNDALQDKLWVELNKAKETFELPEKRRTLIHVEKFEDLINPKINAFENIEWLKDLMCRTAKDFGSTLIFNTKDTSKLNTEAIQPQRIAAQILVKIKTFK